MQKIFVFPANLFIIEGQFQENPPLGVESEVIQEVFIKLKAVRILEPNLPHTIYELCENRAVFRVEKLPEQKPSSEVPF